MFYGVSSGKPNKNRENFNMLNNTQVKEYRNAKVQMRKPLMTQQETNDILKAYFVLDEHYYDFK